MEEVKGFRDVTGEDAERRISIVRIIEDVFNLYGFIPAETPVIENEDFVKGENSSDEAVSTIFKLKDRGNRNLALRYEFTFQLKRLAKNKKLPYKRFEIGPVFRDEPITGNRWRQFTQCDIDTVGSTVKEEAEILKIAKEIFDRLGIKITLNFNNRKLLNEILKKNNIQDKSAVIKEIDKLDKLSEAEVKDNLKKFNAENILKIFKEPEKYFEKYAAYNEIKELRDTCDLYGIKINFVPFLARGLSYYNGSIFEIKASDIKESIAGGGSYLVNGIQSTGISFGLDRLQIIAKIKTQSKKTLIISIGEDKKSIELAKKLRENKISTSIMFGKVSKALDYANSYKIPNVIFIGKDEVKKKKFKLRDMKTGKEVYASEKDLIKKL